MPTLKAKQLRQQEADKLRATLFDMRAELSKLQSNAARGVIQKEAGKIRRARRNVARILTVMREKGIQE